jgi:hypothetical protein
MPVDITKSLQSLTTQKQLLMKREQKLIATLNRLLPRLGYRIVTAALSDGVGRRSAQPRRTMTSRRKSLACPHCDRRFAHPLHLGRHVSAMHRNDASRPSARKVAPMKERPVRSRLAKRGRRAGRAKPSRRLAKKTPARPATKKASA